jgi:hypothetical protein
MTTVAYVAVAPEGRTDSGCLYLREDVVPGLRRLTDAVHAEGALIAAQIGHAGPVANARPTRPRPRPRAVLQPARHATDQGGHRVRHRPDHLGLRGVRHVRGRRLRRARDPPGPQLPAQLVPQPEVQPARRPLGRLAREPGTVRPPGRRGDRDAVGDRVAVTAKLNMVDGYKGGLRSTRASRWRGGWRRTVLSTRSSSPVAARSPTRCTCSRDGADGEEFGQTLPWYLRGGFRLVGRGS